MHPKTNEHMNNELTTNPNTFFFKNNFGKIQDDYIRLGIKQQKVYIREIAFLQVQQQVDKKTNYIAALLGIISMLSTFLVVKSDLLILILSISAVLCLVVSTFYKKENCSVQVVFYSDHEIDFKIHKNQQKGAIEFIKKLSVYRYQPRI